MRIAILIDSLAGGGAEKVMLTLACAFNELGHNCHIICLYNACQYDIPKSVPVHFFRESGILQVMVRAKRYKDFLQQIEDQQGRFELYLSNLDKTNTLAAKLNLPNAFFVIHNSVRDALAGRYRQPFKWLQMRKALQALSGQHLVAVSEGVKSGILQSSLIKPASIRTIYNPLDKANLLRDAQQFDAAIPQENYIIHVGRVARQKRHDILFSALSQTASDIKLVCLCRNINKARRIAARYGVLDRVIFPGFKTNPYPWIKAAKCLVLSSDFEGFAMVLVEALICNVRVVSTDCDFGPREILTGSLANFLVPVGDATALANKIDEALAQTGKLDLPHILTEVEVAVVANRYLALATEQTSEPSTGYLESL
jgi:glycosyltransferase involved in cell wall biosynthesis